MFHFVGTFCFLIVLVQILLKEYFFMFLLIF